MAGDHRMAMCWHSGAGGRHTLRGRLRLSNEGAPAMPVYQFAVKWDDDQNPDLRYTRLADEEAAR
jgi:hypothetical protein